jgi:hypothetical protein
MRIFPVKYVLSGKQNKKGERIQSRRYWQRAYSGSVANFPLEWGGKDNIDLPFPKL